MQAKSKDHLNFPAEENFALRRASKELLSLQKQITALHFKVATEIESLKVAFPGNRLPAVLVAECAVPLDLVHTYLNLEATIGEHARTLKERAVPVGVLKDLVSATPDIRQSLLARIASRSNVTAGQGHRLASDAVRAQMSWEAKEVVARRQTLRRIAVRRLGPSMEDFGQSITEFSQQLLEFHIGTKQIHNEYFGRYDRIDRNDPEYRSRHDEIRSRAAALRDEFEAIYGTSHLPEESWNKAPISRQRAVNVAKAYRALVRFSEGKFAHSGGFTFGPMKATERRFDMWEALQHLTTKTIAIPSGAVAARPQSGKPTALELCAGVGGQALGLTEAGFDLVAVYEKARNAAKGLRTNRPGWKVSEANISSDMEARFKPFRGKVDLISAGLPCQPYSGRGNGRGQFDPRDLFPVAVKIIDLVRPKAFFFENVEGLDETRHGSHRAKIFQDLKDLGYEVQKHSIQSSDYGVAQMRKRLLIVGLLPSIAHRFHLPDPPDRPVATLAYAIGDMLFPYRTKIEDRTRAERSEVQESYDTWSDAWLAEYGQEQSPTITRFGKSREYLTSWIARGFDPQIAPHAFKPEDITDHEQRPRLTVEMLKRLQGLPDSWVLHGKPDGQVMQLANVFPPQAARAVGIAMRHAISGEAIDFDRILSAKVPRPGPDLHRRSKRNRPQLLSAAPGKTLDNGS